MDLPLLISATREMVQYPHSLMLSSTKQCLPLAERIDLQSLKCCQGFGRFGGEAENIGVVVVPREGEAAHDAT